MQIVLRIPQFYETEYDEDILLDSSDPRFKKWKIHDEEDDGIIYFTSPQNVVWTLERCLRYFNNRKLIFGDRQEQYKVLRILDFLVDEHEKNVSYEPEIYIRYINYLERKYPYFRVERAVKKEQYQFTF